MHKRLHIFRTGFAIAAVTLLAAVAVASVSTATAATNCNASSSWGTNRADLASQVVSLINQYRTSKGLSTLATSSPLTASSEWKSLHMAGNGYFDHNDPAPPIARSAYQRATDCGYAGNWWGENIAYGYGSAQAVVNGWLNSAGHKANIENPRFTSTGVGVAANAGGQLYWTQNFGDDASGGSPRPRPRRRLPPPAPAPAPAPAPSNPTPPASTPPVAGSPPAAASAGGAAAPAAPAAPVVVTAPAAPAPAGAPAPTVVLPPVGAKPAHVTRQAKRSRLVASVKFVQLSTGQPLASGSVRCRAEVDGKRLRVVTNAFRATSARCAWRIPAWAKGKQLTGVVAVQVGTSAATRLFMRTVK